MTNERRIQLGTLIRTTREKKRLSLRKVSAQTGIPVPYLSNLERGAYRHPAPDRLVALGDLLGIPAQRIDYLTAGNLTSRLPELRVYLHAKCGLTPPEVQLIQAALNDVYAQRSWTAAVRA